MAQSFPRAATQSKIDCAAALRERLCGGDSALRFLLRAGPLTAKRALIRPHTATLNVTLFSAWTTSDYLLSSYAFLRLAAPTKPIRPEQNSQTVEGVGTALAVFL